MPHDVPDGVPILFVPWFIETILLADVLFYSSRNGLFADVEIPWSQSNKAPGNGYYHKDRWDGDYQPANDEAKHVLVRQAFPPANPNLTNSELRNPTSTNRARCRQTSRDKEKRR